MFGASSRARSVAARRARRAPCNAPSRAAHGWSGGASASRGSPGRRVIDGASRGDGGWRRSAARACSSSTSSRGRSRSLRMPRHSSTTRQSRRSSRHGASCPRRGAWVRLRREAYFASASSASASFRPRPTSCAPMLTSWNGADIDFAGIGDGELRDLARLVAVATAYRRTVDVEEPESPRRCERVAHALGDGGAAAIELLRRPRTRSSAGRRERLLGGARGARRGRAGDDRRPSPRRLLDLEVIYETLVPSSRDHDQTLLFMRLNAEAHLRARLLAAPCRRTSCRASGSRTSRRSTRDRGGRTTGCGADWTAPRGSSTCCSMPGRSGSSSSRRMRPSA